MLDPVSWANVSITYRRQPIKYAAIFVKQDLETAPIASKRGKTVRFIWQRLKVLGHLREKLTEPRSFALHMQKFFQCIELCSAENQRNVSRYLVRRKQVARYLHFLRQCNQDADIQCSRIAPSETRFISIKSVTITQYFTILRLYFVQISQMIQYMFCSSEISTDVHQLNQMSLSLDNNFFMLFAFRACLFISVLWH